MSAALEHRLRHAFGRLPRPARDASDRARAAALSTLPVRERRSRTWVVLVAVAIAAALGIGAAALAATGNLHVELGAKARTPRPFPSRLVLPARTIGIAIVADGKLWLATRDGLRAEGLAVSAAELSPRALYAVAGMGTSLVALAPGHRRAWSQPTRGRVSSIAWSPDGLKIAYVVDKGGSNELRLIEGDGDHDQRLADRVSSARPSWRSDSLAVAYVDARGRAVVYDLASRSRRIFDTRGCGGHAFAVAYAPSAPRLAVAAANGIALVRRWNEPSACFAGRAAASLNGLAWVDSSTLAATTNPLPGTPAESAVMRFRALADGALSPAGGATSRMKLSAIASTARGGPLAVALLPRPGMLELATVTPAAGSATHVRLRRTVLRVGARPSAVSISWR